MFAASCFFQPPAAEYGLGYADAPCAQSGRTVAEDFYTRTYVRDCTWFWDASTGKGMRVAEGLDGGPAVNEYVHFKANATCSDEEWLRRVVIGREPRAICQHRGGEAT